LFCCGAGTVRESSGELAPVYAANENDYVQRGGVEEQKNPLTTEAKAEDSPEL
jgi:hypothetical protein